VATPPLSRPAQLPGHLALRIALAARELKDVDTARLLRALLAVTGEPITEARLGKLRLARLRAALLTPGPNEAAQPELTERQLQRAVGLLKGRGVHMPEEPLPVPQAYRDGELADSVRIACASNSGERLDGSFGSCARFLIYQISPRESRLIELREPGPCGEDDDRNAQRAELLHDCQLLYTLSIGGPAAAKVIRAGVHPIKHATALPAREIVEELQRVLATTPPPWLAKAMGAEPGQRVRFTCDSSA
jgi:nitrogen fixation protein NifX